MSELMQEGCRLLKTGKLLTSPYRAMSNGLCEQFNGVLKIMHGAYAKSQPAKWDECIPYILFAY
jgi:hypothetical protein